MDQHPEASLLEPRLFERLPVAADARVGARIIVAREGKPLDVGPSSPLARGAVAAVAAQLEAVLAVALELVLTEAVAGEVHRPPVGGDRYRTVVVLGVQRSQGLGLGEGPVGVVIGRVDVKERLLVPSVGPARLVAG